VSENKVVLSGALADATGVTTLKINDQVLAYNKEREVDFTFTVQLEEGINKISFAATDMAGNTTTAQLDLIYVPELAKEKLSPSYAYRRKQPVRVALQGSGVLDTGENRYAAVHKSGKLRLNLQDLVPTQTVYYDTMSINGSVTGPKEVKTVKINGEELHVLPGRALFFNQLVELQEGDNKIVIEVVDAAGSKALKEVNIKREIPEIHKIASRMSLAVLPFDVKGQETGSADMAYDQLIDAFIEQGRFNIISRGEQFASVMQELKFSETDLADKSKAVKVGRYVDADAVLMSSVRETKGSLEIYSRLVNTETSTRLDSKDVYTRDKTLSQIQYITSGLALKFKNSFPLIEGKVIKVDGKNIYADFGAARNIKKEMKFIVFGEGGKNIHPITGKVLGSDSAEMGIATIVNVFEDMSLGKLVSGFEASKIKENDLIITK
jgi:TolB-like protein